MHVLGTIPYPWPYDGHLDPTAVAVLLLGDQPTISASCRSAAEVRARLVAVAECVRSSGGVVVVVRYGRRHTDRTGLLPVTGTPGWECRADPGDLVVDARGWDATYSTDLVALLRDRGCSTVVLGGMASEVTVDSTVRALNDQGFECLVLTDGCAPLDAELGRRAHSSLTMSGGIFGALGTTSDLVAALGAARPQEGSS